MRLPAADDDERGSTCLAELSGLPELAVPVLGSTVWNHAGSLDCVDGIPARFVALYEHGRIRWNLAQVLDQLGGRHAVLSPCAASMTRLPSAPSRSTSPQALQ